LVTATLPGREAGEHKGKTMDDLEDIKFYRQYDKGFVDGARAALKDAGWCDAAIAEWLALVESDTGEEPAYKR